MRCLFDVSPRRELQLLRSAHYKENSRLTGMIEEYAKMKVNKAYTFYASSSKLGVPNQ